MINPVESVLFNSYSRSERMRILMHDMCESDGVAIVSDDYYIADIENEIAASLSIPVRTVKGWISWKSK